MRLAVKRRLDFYVGRPLLWLSRLAARIVALVHRRDHDTEPVNSILIVKFQGLGSLILAKPALAELRRSRPTARIIFWGTRAMQPLAEQMPEFDEVIVLDDRTLASSAASTLRALVRFWRSRIDWVIDLEVYSRLSSVLVTLTCARNRTGFALEMMRSRRVHTHLVYFNRHRHLGEAYARIIGQLLPADRVVDGLDYGSWRFATTPLDGLPPRYFVFNIHAGDLALERRWPRESFRRLIDELLRVRGDATAVIIGHGPAEVAYAAGLGGGDRIVNLSGTLDFRDTYRVIANAELIVTNDTAPLHVALSTRVKVLGLFGPTQAETYLPPGRPYTEHAEISLYCSPCVHYWDEPPCNGDNQCMKGLQVSAVLSKCCALLGLPSPAPQPAVPAERSTYYPGLVYKRIG